MSNFPRKRSPSAGPFELPEVVTPSSITFLGEQTDPAAETYKAMLRRAFEGEPRLFQRAYLARVSYGDPGVSSVTLCVRHVEGIEKTLQRGFKYVRRDFPRGRFLRLAHP